MSTNQKDYLSHFIDYQHRDQWSEPDHWIKIIRRVIGCLEHFQQLHFDFSEAFSSRIRGFSCSWPFSVGCKLIGNILPGRAMTLSILSITLSSNISTALFTFSPANEITKVEMKSFVVMTDDLEISSFTKFTCKSARFDVGNIVLFCQVPRSCTVHNPQVI